MVIRTVMEKVKASVDPEPALEKFGCGVSRRENIFRRGHVWRGSGTSSREFVCALMFGNDRSRQCLGRYG